jgi:hypothetical protein
MLGRQPAVCSLSAENADSHRRKINSNSTNHKKTIWSVTEPTARLWKKIRQLENEVTAKSEIKLCE